MTSLPYEDVLPRGALALALVRAESNVTPLRTPDLSTATRAASERDLDRDAIVGALAAGLERLSAPPASRAAAERLRDPRSVVVVAGQQPGLLGGPAMVLVKALDAVAVARRAEAAHGVPVVPVFWHASEDHDHAEADHIQMRGAEALVRLDVPLPGDRTMLSEVAAPAPAASVAARAIDLLPAGPDYAALAARLPPLAGESMGAWSGRLLAAVLGPLGVVVVEPRSLRALGSSVVEHELLHPGALAASIADAEAQAEAAGFDAPLGLVRSTLFFLVEDGRRLRVAPDGAGFRVEGGPPQTSAALLARLRTSPGDFSWNVAGRVLAQDIALPVAAQVCGPSELGYVSLLGAAHARLGVPQPAALLRRGVTVVEPRVARACARLEVQPADVIRAGAAALPPASPSVAAAIEGLSARVTELPEGRSAAVRRRRDAILRELGLYGAALERERAEADAARERRTRTVLEALRPRGRLQERVLSPLSWLARYGERLLEQILEALSDEAVEHVILNPDPEAPSKETNA